MAGPIRIALLANGRQARAEINRTAGSLGIIGKSASRAGKLIAGAFAVGALVRVGKAVGEVGGQYVSALNKIQALTGSTDAQMSSLATKLESQSGAFAKFGQTTGDAANGMVELAKSGLSAQKALAAIRGTMTLAKAGEMDVADASALVANTLNTFNLKASKAADIANSLANAANISSADVRDVAESFKYVAPLAAKAGISVDQTNAALAELANSGIKASQAGTTMRGMLVALQAPSTAGGMWLDELGVKVYGAGGKMRDFGAILEDLRKGLAKVSDEDANFALKSIFGRNSITGASVLIKGGVKELSEYTKGVKRAGAATKLAESASKGLAGTFASIKANATSTVQELYRKYSPVVDNALRGTIGLLRDHKDDFQDLARSAVPALQAVGDMLSSLATLAADAAKSFGSGNGGLARTLGKEFLGAIEKLAGLVKAAADGLDKLPGPVKSIAIQAGLAALVLPRLTAGITAATSSVALNIARLQQWRAEMTYSVTRAQATATAMQRLGTAAKTAAGVGGMVLLANATGKANHALGLFEGAAGGALLGFSVGGPLGAAIGGTAGALYGLATATSEAAVETVKAKDNTKAYVDTLNELTGASTRATRARIFDRLMADKQTASMLEQSGVAARDVVSAVMGQKGAWGRLGAQLEKTQRQYDRLKDPESARGRALARQIFALRNLVPEIREESSNLASSIQATKEKAAAVLDWGKALKGIPKNVRAELKNQNYDLTRKQVDQLADKYNLLPAQKRTILRALGADAARTAAQRALEAYNALPPRIQSEIREVGGGETKKRLREIVREYKLTPKQVRLLVQATGAKAAVKDLGGVRRAVENTGKVKVSNKWLGDFKASLATGGRAAESGGSKVRKNIEHPIAQTRPDLSALMSGISNGTARAARVGRSGGTSAGSALGQGIYLGVGGWAEPIASRAAAIVHAAVAAAKAAGKIHSPSRVMRDEVGAMLGKGLEDGLRAKERDGEQAGKSYMTKVLRGVNKGSDGIKKVLDRITHLIETKLDGKKQASRRKALLKSLKDERAALLANGKAQDRNAKALDKAVEKYKALKQRADEFARSIRTGFQTYGSIVGLGTTGGGTMVTLPAILSQLQARTTVAEQFATVIKSLRDKLNKTSLRQLLEQAAGGDLEGALATAQAIAGGGAAAITQINQLTQQIAQAGADLGEKMRKKFFGHGLQVAEGVVEGLKRREKKLDRVADRLAAQFVRKAQQGLHITATPGSLPASQTHNRTATPALDAYMSSRSSTATAASVKITLSAEQVSQLQRGREIQADLDVYHGAGGRAKVRTK